MKLEKIDDFQSKIIIENYDNDEYKKFIDIKRLPYYSVKKNEIIVNNNFLDKIGFDVDVKVDKNFLEFNSKLFDYQIFITKLAVIKKRFAIFSDCGTGKTNCLLEWGKQISQRIDTNKKILCVSPLMVLNQTKNEQMKFYGIDEYINCHKYGFDVWLNSDNKYGIVNYDLFRNKIDFGGRIGAIILDESSALKHEQSVIRTNIINASKGIEYKLCCTATPAPNDRSEFANTAFFLEYVRSYQEFFQRYFMIRDNNWILKPHATESFYRYLSTFSIFLRDPKTYGFEDNLKDLKEPIINEIKVDVTSEQSRYIAKISKKKSGFGLIAKTDGIVTSSKLSQLSKGFIYVDGRDKIDYVETKKPQVIFDLCKKHPHEQVLIWTTFDEEGEILKKKLEKEFTVENLNGKMKQEKRIEVIESFLNNKLQILISKPKLLGFGLNFQNVSVVIYSGMDYSFEKFYQSLRRVYRYGNTKEISVYIPFTNYEEPMIRSVFNKEANFNYDASYQENLYKKYLINDLIEFANKGDIVLKKEKPRKRKIEKGDNWTLIYGDNIEELDRLEENSIHFSIFSPPFADLFTYSSEIEDMGNCNEDDDEFTLNYTFFAKRLYRVIMPGRKVAVHVMQLPILKSVTGYCGMKDFRALICESMNKCGFIFKGEVAIKRNQQQESIVNHRPGLAMHIFKKDSNNCIPCYNDYILIFSKDGENKIPITPYQNGEMSGDDWVKFASGCWMIDEFTSDIRMSDTLNTKNAKSEEDEKHICPFVLEPVRRFVKLYSNPNETVLDPFNGIGSTGVICMENRRKYIGIELKKEYFDESIKNIKREEKLTQSKFFGLKK